MIENFNDDESLSFTDNIDNLNNKKQKPKKNNSSNNKRFSKHQLVATILSFSISLALFLGVLIGYFVFNKESNFFPPEQKELIFNKYQNLEKIERELKKRFYKNLSDEEIKKAYYKALIALANDKYTGIRELSNTISLSDGGYGISVSNYEDDHLLGVLVTDIQKGTQAERDLINTPQKALLPGDIIIGAYNGSNYIPLDNGDPYITKENKFLSFYNLLRLSSKNPERDIVVFNPAQNDKNKTRRIKMKYEKYPNYKAVESKIFTKDDLIIGGNNFNPDKNIAFLRIKLFDTNASTLTELERLNLKPEVVAKATTLKFNEKSTEFLVYNYMHEINEKLNSENDELIIDLRNNPGGDLVSVLNVINSFLPKGSESQPLFSLISNFFKDEKVREYKTYFQSESFGDNSQIGLYAGKNYKIKILVNENSASAAEVMSSVLKEHMPNCKVIGSETYGKDLYQSSLSLNPNDDFNFPHQLSITEGKWGFYKKGETNIKNFKLITEEPFKIVQKGSENYIKSNPFSTFKFAPILRALEYDKVYTNSNKFSFTSLIFFLNDYLKENIANIVFKDPLKDPELLKENKLFRLDGYFDKTIEYYLQIVNTKLITQEIKDALGYNDFDLNKFTYASFIAFYSYARKNDIFYDNEQSYNFDTLTGQSSLNIKPKLDMQMYEALLK